MDYSAVEDGLITCKCGRRWNLVAEDMKGVLDDDGEYAKKWTWVATPPVVSSGEVAKKAAQRQFWAKKSAAKKAEAQPSRSPRERVRVHGPSGT